MSTWLIPESDLTPEQRRAVELSPAEHRVIFGAPGSGKTQILLHRANYLRERFSVAPDRFHIFVFTNVLKDYIQSALDLLNLPADCVSTFDLWCKDFHVQHVGKKLPWDARNKKPDFAKIREGVLQNLQARLSDKIIYDFVLVDEGQDLDETSFELLKTIAKHVTVCVDHKPQIYEGGASEGAILTRLGLKKRNVSLLEAFRSCPYVVHLAAQFVADPEARTYYVRQAKTAQTERMKPLLYYAKDFDDEKRRLIEVLRTHLAKGETVAVLFPNKRLVFGFATGLREEGLEVETQDTLSFTSGLPRLITYPSAKGLTFDTVLLPRLVPRSFYSISSEKIEQLLFVAISRATKWVYLSTTVDSPLSQLERLSAAPCEEWLTVQQASNHALGATAAEPASPLTKPEESLLDLL